MKSSSILALLSFLALTSILRGADNQTAIQFCEDLRKVIPKGWSVDTNKFDPQPDYQGIQVWRNQKVKFGPFEEAPNPVNPQPLIPSKPETFYFTFTVVEYLSPDDFDAFTKKNQEIEARLIEYKRALAQVSRNGKSAAYDEDLPVGYKPKTELEKKLLGEFQDYYQSNPRKSGPDYHFKDLSFSFFDPRIHRSLKSSKTNLECTAVLEAIRNVGAFYDPSSAPSFVANGAHLVAGNYAIPYLFEEKVEGDLLNWVDKDLYNIFKPAKSHRFLPESPKKWMIDGRELESRKFLHFEGDGIYYPISLSGKIGSVIEIDGTDLLVVSKDLISLFRKASEFIEENEEDYWSLIEFINNVNRANYENPLKMSLDELYWTDKPKLSVRSFMEIPDLLRNTSNRKLRYPSILDIERFSEKQADEEATLIAKTFWLDPNSGVPTTRQRIVFHDGKWKLYYPERRW